MSALGLPEEDELGGAHLPNLRSYGDGRTTPQERSVTCSCGEFEWTWEQHYDERDDLDEAWEKHLRDHTAEAREQEQDALDLESAPLGTVEANPDRSRARGDGSE